MTICQMINETSTTITRGISALIETKARSFLISSLINCITIDTKFEPSWQLGSRQLTCLCRTFHVPGHDRPNELTNIKKYGGLGARVFQRGQAFEGICDGRGTRLELVADEVRSAGRLCLVVSAI